MTSMELRVKLFRSENGTNWQKSIFVNILLFFTIKFSLQKIFYILSMN